MPLTKKMPVKVVDAGKFLHQFNISAQSQIAIFEERVATMGRELGANWQLTSLSKDTLIIEDADIHKYYQADIENLGKGSIRITNFHELKIIESKKEDVFKRNLFELVNSISENKTKDADSIFNRITKQRFRSSVIPEHGVVTTRDGKSRFINVSKNVVEESNQNEIIKTIAKVLKNGVRVIRGGIVEATFNMKKISIPITELTRRKVIASEMKSVAVNAYQSEGFNNRIKHIAALVTKAEVKEAVEFAAEFLTENQEFTLLNEEEMQKLISDSLATNLCFNNDLADDVGELLYRTNCRINRDVIISEWRKTARMTQYTPFVENIRKLEESKDFETSYSGFLNAIFMESAKDLKLEAAEHLIILRKIRDVLSTSKDLKEDIIQQIENYVHELEVGGDSVDDATVMEVRRFLSGLSEQIIESAAAYDQFASPDAGGTLDTFDSVQQSSSAEPKTFGGGVDLGGTPSIAGAASATPPGEELAAAPGGAPIEGAPPEGEEGEGEGEDVLAGLFDSVIRAGKSINENEEEKNEKNEKHEKNEKNEDEESEDKPKKPWEKLKNEEVIEIRTAVSSLDADSLSLELKEWKENGWKYFAKDGLEKASVQVKAYVDHASALKLPQLAEEFNKVLISNIPIQASVENVQESEDPYEFTTKERIGKYNVKEDHDTWSNKMKESENGVDGAGSPKRVSGGAMGKAGENRQNELSGGNKGATLKGGGKVADNKVKESGNGLPTGKNPKTSDAMGQAGEKDQNVAHNMGEKSNTLKGGKVSTENKLVTAVLKKFPRGTVLTTEQVQQIRSFYRKNGQDGHSAPITLNQNGNYIIERLKAEGMVCPSCKKSHDIAAYLGEETAICPNCGNDVYELVMEALNVGMDQEGKGLQDKKVGKSTNSGSGDKPSNDCPEGKGVAKSTLTKHDGSREGGKKDGMDGQEGKPISGRTKGEVEEAGRRPPTKRKGFTYPFKQNSGYKTEEGTEIDSIAASIMEAEDDEEHEFNTDDVASPEAAGGPGAKVPEDGIAPSADLPPNDGDMPLDTGDDDELTPSTSNDGDMPLDTDDELTPSTPEAQENDQEIVVKPNSTITVKVNDEAGSANQVTLNIQPEGTDAELGDDIEVPPSDTDMGFGGEGEAADLEGEAADLEGEAADLEGEAGDLEGEAGDLESEAGDLESEAAEGFEESKTILPSKKVGKGMRKPTDNDYSGDDDARAVTGNPKPKVQKPKA